MIPSLEIDVEAEEGCLGLKVTNAALREGTGVIAVRARQREGDLVLEVTRGDRGEGTTMKKIERNLADHGRVRDATTVNLHAIATLSIK